MRYFSTEKKFLLCLGLYTLLHMLFRIFISNSLEKDEAEMILYTQQQLAWGYNSQPPLYVWLQLAFFKIFGISVLALAFLKNSLILLLYFFLYRSAKIILNNSLSAILSTVSLFLIYNFSWIMHKDLTHSVLLMALCSATFYVLVKLLSSKKPLYYCLLGACMGLGLITKYNYSIFAIALIASAISVSAYRPAILNKKMLLTLATVILITAGHFNWCIANPDLLTSDVGDFKRADGTGAIFGLKGLSDLLEQTFLFILPLLVMYAAFFFKSFVKAFTKLKEKVDIQAFMNKFFLFSLFLVVILIIIGDVGKIKARWLGPFLFLMPLYFFIRIKGFDTGKKQKLLFIAMAAFCAIATLFSVWGRVVFASSRGKYRRLNYPYTELSQLIKEENFQKGLIIAEDQVIGANLKLYFKDSFIVVAQERFDANIMKHFENVLIIWEDDISHSYTQAIEEVLRERNLLDRQPLVKKALYKYSTDKYYHLNMFILKNINT
jgi:dolichyl-phosphate-mannose-protein mannosyltransferase